MLGFTVPQRQSFYGAPTLAAQLGLGAVSGPLIMQACATSVACVHAAAAVGRAASGWSSLTDRTSNGPHIVYPRAGARRAARRAARTGCSTTSAATRTRARGCSRPPSASPPRAASPRRARRGDRAPLGAVRRRAGRRPRLPEALDGPDHRRLAAQADEIDADWGIRPAPLEALDRRSPPVEAGGVVSYGSQTHPADGCAGPDRHRAGRTRVDGPSPASSPPASRASARGEMPKAPVPARRRGAARTPGCASPPSTSSRPTTRSRSTTSGSPARPAPTLDAMNPFGCIADLRPPAGPDRRPRPDRADVGLHDRGGGRGLFTGCAAGDTGAARGIEVG